MVAAATAGTRTLVVTAAVGKEVVLVVNTVHCRRSIRLMPRLYAPFRRHRYHLRLHRIGHCDHRRRTIWHSHRLLRMVHGRRRRFSRSPRPPFAGKSFIRRSVRWNSLSVRRQQRRRQWNGPGEGKHLHNHLRRQEVQPVHVFHRGHRALESRFLIEEKETCHT